MTFCSFLFHRDAGNLVRTKNGKFSTKDVDNDICSDYSSAEIRQNTWWFKECSSHLNGQYLGGHHNQKGKGIDWYYFKGPCYSYTVTEMKVGHDQN